MDGRHDVAHGIDDDAPPRAPLAAVMADLAASDAEADAGELVDGEELLAELRKAAADLRAELASRRA